MWSICGVTFHHARLEPSSRPTVEVGENPVFHCRATRLTECLRRGEGGWLTTYCPISARTITLTSTSIIPTSSGVVGAVPPGGGIGGAAFLYIPNPSSLDVTSSADSTRTTFRPSPEAIASALAFAC